MYSKNQLTNPSAETGDLSGWTVEGSGLSVAAGGTDGSYCFAISGISGQLSQQRSYGITPLDFKIQGDFLPPTDPPDGSTTVMGMLKINMAYGDGTNDQIKFPARDDTKE